MKIITNKTLLLLIGISFVFLNEGMSQMVQLRGKVVDGETGNALSKVILIVQGADYDFFTSATGSYAIPQEFAKKKMTVSYVGYISQEVKLVEGETLTISLEREIITLPPMELTSKKYNGPDEYLETSAEDYKAHLKSMKQMDEEGMDVYASPASFPKGWENLHAYFFKSFEYPVNAIKFKQRGVLYVGFTIDEEGRAVDVSLLDGEGENGMSEAIVSLVQNMPAWYPAFQYGTPVTQKFIVIFPFVAK